MIRNNGRAKSIHDHQSLAEYIFSLLLRQYSSVVSFFVSTTDRLSPILASHLSIPLKSFRLTPVTRYIMIHRSNQGYINKSASDTSLPSMQSPFTTASNSPKTRLTSCWKSSIDVTCLYLTLSNSPITAADCWPINRRIRALQKVSAGMRLLPDDGNTSARYQQTGSLSASTRSPWMSTGTFPLDLGSFPNAFLYVLFRTSSCPLRLTLVKVASRSFSIAVSRARCAKGQNLLQMIVRGCWFCIGME